MQDCGTERQETSVETHQAEELSQLALGSRLRKCTDSLYLLLQRLAADAVAQEFEGGRSPYILVWVDGEAVFSKAFEDKADVSSVFLRRRAYHQQVVHVVKGEVETT